MPYGLQKKHITLLKEQNCQGLQKGKPWERIQFVSDKARISAKHSNSNDER